MASPPVSPELLAEAVAAFEKYGGINPAARALGIPRTTLQSRLHAAERNTGVRPEPIVPMANPLPDPDLPIEAIVAHRKAAFERKHAHHLAKRWRKYHVPTAGPYALMFFGDPHLDDDGCHLPLWESHVELAANTDGLFAINIGDTTNNWAGRLARLWADQNASAETARKLVKHYLAERGIPWLLWLSGNHDCLTMDHEILTRRGWLLFDDLNPTDEVAGINPKTGLREWQPILATISKNVDSIVEASGAGFSIACTERHRIFGQRRKSDKSYDGYSFSHPADMPSRFRVPVSAHSGNSEYPISDDWLKLLGWVITDGTYPKPHSGVIIYQSKDAGDIRQTLEVCGIAARESVRTRDVESVCGRPLVKKALPQSEFYISASDGRKIRELLPEKLQIPTWVYDLSSRQFDLLLKAIVAGDGSVYPKGRKGFIVYGRKQFLDSLQAACTMHGYRAALTMDNRGSYRLNICNRQFFEIERTQTPFVEVKGDAKVWCLSVPHGNFLIRRNGFCHFTGNCWDGPVGRLVFEQHAPHFVTLEDWQAKVTLVSPCGSEVRLWAAHNFKGSSIWNNLHGLERAAQMQDWAHLYVAGHHHDTGIRQGENPHRGFVYNLMRVRGYKYIDDYADHHGFGEHQYGASGIAVVDPNGDKLNRVTCFLDPFEAVEFLKFKRRNHEG